MEQTSPAVLGPVEPTVMQHEGTLAHGWYWVRFDRGNYDLTDPMAALWDGHQWRSVGWSWQRLDGPLVLQPCRPPQDNALDVADAARIARGCTDYGGGYRGDAALFEAYQAGILTVVAALEAAGKRGLEDSQVRALHRMGAA